jgi:hypothetical protein
VVTTIRRQRRNQLSAQSSAAVSAQLRQRIAAQRVAAKRSATSRVSAAKRSAQIAQSALSAQIAKRLAQSN